MKPLANPSWKIDKPVALKRATDVVDAPNEDASDADNERLVTRTRLLSMRDVLTSLQVL